MRGFIKFIRKRTLSKCCAFLLFLIWAVTGVTDQETGKGFSVLEKQNPKISVWLPAGDRAGADAEKSTEGSICAGEYLLAAGTVAAAEEKEKTDHKKQIIVTLHSVTFCNKKFPQEKKKLKEGILCYLEEGEQMPLYGQQILVSGRAENFSGSRNAGGFHAKDHYRSRKIRFYMEAVRIEKRGKEYSRLLQGLHELRERLCRKLKEICGEDAGIMCSLLLGDQKLLPKEIKKLYQSGGISHILAISGLHISFLGAGLYRILGCFLPKRVAAAGSGSFLAGYVFLSGASPSACRAGGMFLLGILAEGCGRSYDRQTALFVCALFQILQNPFLFRSSSFWLSYGAVFGLMVLPPLIGDLWKSRKALLFLPGLSVFFLTLPVQLSFFYEVPLYSFFLNLFVIPLMSVVMADGLISLFAGFFSVSFGRCLFYPVHVILMLFEYGCRLCRLLPENKWILGAPPAWRIIVYISLLFLFLLLGRYLAKAGTLLFLAGAVWILTGMQPLSGSITCLDVGQGDGIAVRDGDGRTVLIDGGSSSEKNLAEYTLLPYFKSQGIRQLDLIIVTHTDADHISGVKELLSPDQREIRVRTLLLPEVSAEDEAYRELTDLAKQADVRIGVLKKGDRFRCGEMEFYCLHPEREKSYADKNQASLVLYLRMNELTALFTGDLDGEAERQLAGNYPEAFRQVDILKAGHHGSAASCGEEFLETVLPACVVISCGEQNSYGHPAKETLERLGKHGIRTFVTAKCGAVRIEE